jgi:NMD protein affecting ribosome stability and mRNA decay
VTPEPTRTCDECGSSFIAARSAMAGLCAECARWLYGYPACAHAFENARCKLCGWDGSVSAFVGKLKADGDQP